MSKMITNLVTTVLYEADKRIDKLAEAYFNTLTLELKLARNLVYPEALLLTGTGTDRVCLDMHTYGRLCDLQRTLREWYKGAPNIMSVVPPNTVEILQKLDNASSPDRMEQCMYEVIEEVLKNCPNWTDGPPVVPEATPVDATADADIPHTTDTGEDAQTQSP